MGNDWLIEINLNQKIYFWMNVKSIVVGGGFGNLWVALNSYTEFVLMRFNRKNYNLLFYILSEADFCEYFWTFFSCISGFEIVGFAWWEETNFREETNCFLLTVEAIFLSSWLEFLSDDYDTLFMNTFSFNISSGNLS